MPPTFSHSVFVALVGLVGCGVAGCDGVLGSDQAQDVGASIDANVLRVDAFVPPGTDASMSTSPDAYSAPPDAFVGPDAYVPSMGGPCMLGAPLAEPIAGCRPTTPPMSGDAHEDCVRRINQFRCECQHLQPLMRDRAGEGCADMMAQYDFEHGMTPHAGYRAGICSGGGGQNECPGWGSIPQCVEGCLQQMWDEGPGDFYGPPAHGHYINMSSTSFGSVSCGFYVAPGGSTWAVQNFH